MMERVLARDRLSRRELVLVDRGLGSSQNTRTVSLAVGLVPFGDCFMTTGTALPLPAEAVDDVVSSVLKEQGIPYTNSVSLTKRQQVVFAGNVIRLALAGGMGEHVRYQ